MILAGLGVSAPQRGGNVAGVTGQHAGRFFLRVAVFAVKQMLRLLSDSPRMNLARHSRSHNPGGRGEHGEKATRIETRFICLIVFPVLPVVLALQESSRAATKLGDSSTGLDGSARIRRKQECTRHDLSVRRAF
jgi:hypothetical protein